MMLGLIAEAIAIAEAEVVGTRAIIIRIMEMEMEVVVAVKTAKETFAAAIKWTTRKSRDTVIFREVVLRHRCQVGIVLLVLSLLDISSEYGTTTTTTIIIITI